MDYAKLLEQVIAIGQRAGEEVLKIYKSDDFGVESKVDNTPITLADKASHKVIDEGLSKISDFPIVSEENEMREAGEIFWLVDPIDGTKDFIKKTDEFTVNIALIENGEPVLGLVGAPAKNAVYAGAKSIGAIKIDSGNRKKIESNYGDGVPKVVTSASSRGGRMTKLLDLIGEFEEVGVGSSLKFCIIAEGKAMYYPRLGPQHGWDTAAGDAVLRSAGGLISDFTGKPLQYTPGHELNPNFIARTKDSKDLVFQLDDSELFIKQE